MSKTSTLLVELVAEELPPKALKSLGEAFARSLSENLRRANLQDSDARDPTWFASPRRLAVSIPGVRSAAPERSGSERPRVSHLAGRPANMGGDGW